jgi:hybrid cluster-associated redox disulfide protein
MEPFTALHSFCNSPFAKGENMKLQVTKDTLIGEVLNADNTTVPYFFEMGMHCLGCPASSAESLEDACAVHGVEVEELVNQLNDHMNK